MGMESIADWKIDAVSDLRSIISGYRTVAVVKVDRIPGFQMQQIRSLVRGDLRIKVAKKTLIDRALKEESPNKAGIERLSEHIDGQAAILGTDLNPFKLFNLLKMNMQPMPAKGGETAPEDITIKDGETPFPAGPIVGELGKVGIPAAIDKGKVVIRKTVTPVKKGQTINRDLAQILTKLEIFPFTAGVVLLGAYEDGEIFEAKDLDIDMEAYRQNMVNAAQLAFNLAVFTAYPTPQTIVPILARARGQALGLAVGAGILNKDSLDLILSRAYGSILALARAMSAEALDDELRALLEGAAKAAPAPAAVESAKEAAAVKEEPEEEAPSEEEAMAGLGALFG